jgi:hypothetical protein
MKTRIFQIGKEKQHACPLMVRLMFNLGLLLITLMLKSLNEMKIQSNLPLSDILIPLAHLLRVPMYICEHWTGLNDGDVQDAWDIKPFTTPFSGNPPFDLLLFTHNMSENQICCIPFIHAVCREYRFRRQVTGYTCTFVITCTSIFYDNNKSLSFIIVFINAPF